MVDLVFNIALLACSGATVADSSFPAVSTQGDTTSGPDISGAVLFDPTDLDALFGQAMAGDLLPANVEELWWLREHPYDLNTATTEQLCSIPLVSALEASLVVKTRRNRGRFLSVEELKGINDRMYEKLRGYVEVLSDPSGDNRRIVELRTRITETMPPGGVSGSDRYAGSPLKAFGRITARPARGSEIGAVFEKDAGERFRDGFTSGFCHFRSTSVLSDVILGDFVVDGGQGLVLGHPAADGVGKGPLGGAGRTESGLLPCRSAAEDGYFRGIALALRLPPSLRQVRVIALFSQRFLSGTIDGNGNVTALYTTGLYRTTTEIAKKSVVRERVIGGRTECNATDCLVLGVSGYWSTFDRSIAPGREGEFSGDRVFVAGADARVQIDRLAFCTEVAASGHWNLAWVAGGTLRLSEGCLVGFAYHAYAPGYADLHSGGFSENGSTRNEKAAHAGVEVASGRWLVVRGGIDCYRSLWKTYFNPLPVNGFRTYVQANMNPTRPLKFAARFAARSAEVTGATRDSLNREKRSIVDRFDDEISLTVTYHPHTRFTAESRICFRHVSYTALQRAEQGMVVTQGIHWEISKGLALDWKMAFYDTDSYDSRIYIMESDLRGVSTHPPLYDEGRRWFVLLHWKPFRWFELSAKYTRMQSDRLRNPPDTEVIAMEDLDSRFGIQIDAGW